MILLKVIKEFIFTIKGSVLIDGVDIKTLDPSWLRKQIALVSQVVTQAIFVY